MTEKGSGLLNRPVVLAVSAVVLVLVLSSCGESNGLDDDRALAQVDCQTEVTKELRAPATAEFANWKSIGRNPMTVSGTVDSENAFGAMLRASFQCTAMFHASTVDITVDSLG